jgi:hypothetical protein
VPRTSREAKNSDFRSFLGSLGRNDKFYGNHLSGTGKREKGKSNLLKFIKANAS